MKRCRSDDTDYNIVNKVLRRETSMQSNRFLVKHSATERFKNINLKAIMDCHDPLSTFFKSSYSKKKSKVVEIVATSEVIFGLTHSGVCAAFHQESKMRICYLNITPGEVIRSLFYNKTNESIITVSVYRIDNFSSLKCRSTYIKSILNNNPTITIPLFESESLRWPGFVEFDDVNAKVLTFSATDRVYKVWELENYSTLYTLSNKHIQEIKISPGIMLLIFNRSPLGVSFALICYTSICIQSVFNVMYNSSILSQFWPLWFYCILWLCF